MRVSADGELFVKTHRTDLCALVQWIDIARPGWANMAIDQTLLERAAAGERWLRLYGWNPFCLSFGRNEPATRRYDADRIERLGLDVVRRPTGGRAVWHGRELTYTVACPVELATLRESYLEIHRMLRMRSAVSAFPPSWHHRDVLLVWERVPVSRNRREARSWSKAER